MVPSVGRSSSVRDRVREQRLVPVRRVPVRVHSLPCRFLGLFGNKPCSRTAVRVLGECERLFVNRTDQKKPLKLRGITK